MTLLPEASTVPPISQGSAEPKSDAVPLPTAPHTAEIDPHLGKALIHLSLFTVFIPVLVWMHFKDKPGQFRQHALEALNFLIFCISSQMIIFTSSMVVLFPMDDLGILSRGISLVISLTSTVFSLFFMFQVFWNAKLAYEGKQASYLNPFRLLK